MIVPILLCFQWPIYWYFMFALWCSPGPTGSPYLPLLHPHVKRYPELLKTMLLIYCTISGVMMHVCFCSFSCRTQTSKDTSMKRGQMLRNKSWWRLQRNFPSFPELSLEVNCPVKQLNVFFCMDMISYGIIRSFVTQGTLSVISHIICVRWKEVG